MEALVSKTLEYQQLIFLWMLDKPLPTKTLPNKSASSAPKPDRMVLGIFSPFLLTSNPPPKKSSEPSRE